MFVKKITLLVIKKQPLNQGLFFVYYCAIKHLYLVIFFLFNCSQEPKNSAETDCCDNYKKKDIKQMHSTSPPNPYALYIVLHGFVHTSQIVDKLMNNVTDKLN